MSEQNTRLDLEDSKRRKLTDDKEVGKDSATSEPECGILEFLDKDENPLIADFKARYSDFIVHEIDADGNVTVLTNCEISESVCRKKPTEKLGGDQAQPTTLEERKEKLAMVLQDQTIYDTLSSLSKTYTSIAIPSKEDRRLIHGYISILFKNKLDSITNIEKQIVVFPDSNSNKSGNRQWQSNMKSYNELGGEYCHFTLYKENSETFEILDRISQILRINIKNLSIAGTKDKRACTTQRVSAQKVNAEQLAGLNKMQNLQIGVGNFEYKQEPLRLGSLNGNRFTVALRNVLADVALIDKRINFVKDNGFINYYGMQRFGTGSIPTHHVGIKILEDNYQDAVKLLITSHEEYDKIPRKNVAERSIVRWLNDHPNDYSGAINSISRNLRSLYLHAVQSFFWNYVVSLRIQKHGTNVLLGDFVSKRDSSKAVSNCELHENTYSVVTQEDLESGKYTIYDVLIPALGFKTKMPENDVRTFYKDLLQKYNIDEACFSLKKQERFLTGFYRQMLVQPGNLSYEIVKYESVEDDIITKDFDVITKKCNGNKQNTNNTGSKTAIVLDFQLPACSYASMLAREVMHSGTDAASYNKTLP